VYTADDSFQLKYSSRRAFGPAIAVSLSLHVLIFWLTARYLFDAWRNDTPSKPRTIHLTLTRIQETGSDSVVRRHSPSPSGTDETGASKDGAPRKQARHNADHSKPPPSASVINTPKAMGNSAPFGADPGRVSASRIIATAKSYVREMATDDTTETKQKASPVASALERAFNPRTEPPGVTTLADGTIRVVTPFGTKYCIKPKDDFRILGPEDDLPVSMTCSH
jgi:hypothetical protein